MADAPRLLLLTDGDWTHASSRIRGAAYIPFLERQGYHVTWLARTGRSPRSMMGRLRFALQKRWRTVRLKRLLTKPWDVALVQRRFLPAAALAALARCDVPLVYDFDDALYLDTPGRTSRAQAAARMVEAARAVVVGSPALAPFCRAYAKEPVFIPTPVDTDRIRPATVRSERFVVGWIGSPWTTPYLATLAEPLRMLSDRLDFQVLAVGADPAQMHFPGVEVEVVPWTYEEEAAQFARMSAGIMPLPPDRWAEGKGAYKLYQYMAAGLPVVASPVGLNREVVTPDVGMLAETPGEWVEALGRLAADPVLCRQMGAAGRHRAETTFSRTVCFQQLQDVLERARRKSS